MDGLPASFTTRNAFDILKWQGSRKGLARHLEADGYVRVATFIGNGDGTRMVWRKPSPVGISASPPPVDSDRWECGSDEQIAKLALRLIERNAIATIEAFHWLEGQISAAGPRFCREMLMRFSDEEVPF